MRAFGRTHMCPQHSARLIGRDAISQSSDDLYILNGVGVLLPAAKRNPEIVRGLFQAGESRLSNSDYREGPPTDVDPFPDDGPIPSENLFPSAVARHRDGTAIERAERSSQNCLSPQHREVIGTHQQRSEERRGGKEWRSR